MSAFILLIFAVVFLVLAAASGYSPFGWTGIALYVVATELIPRLP